MSRNIKTLFTKDNKIQLPVNIDKYLLALLSSTSPGTNYWESAPPAKISENQLGRILLQVHQILSIYESMNIDLNDKNFLDIGTGNGMIPRIILFLSNLSKSTGVDPYLDGEHKSSWQKHDHDETLMEIKNFILQHSDSFLDYKNYAKYTNRESFVFQPQPIKIPKSKNDNYGFYQIGINNLSKLNEKFDLIYCKAIEHISDWETAFKSVSKASNQDAFFYLKHRSFFSYLGAHRYSSTGIPWGHLLLTDSEYRRYCEENHSSRHAEMIRFFFNDLTYPRNSLSEMITIAKDAGFNFHGMKIETPKYNHKTFHFINDIDNFWKIIQTNYPNLSSHELFSGMAHIIFKKQ